MKWWYKPQWWQWTFIALLLPLSGLYYLIVSLRRYAYRQGLKASYRAPVPVIVVGNISVGGNGKTPLVIALVEYLQKAGYKPGVISRGYGGKAPHYPYLLTDSSIAEYSGDEPLLIYRRCACPVVVGAKRSANIQVLLEQACDIVISDDGMQHYAMQRDIEIAVIDAVRQHGNGLCLPAGPLRETKARLKQLDLCVYNGDIENGEHKMLLRPQAFRRVNDQQSAEPPQQNVTALAGIGHPPRFYRSIEALGFCCEHCVDIGDHQHLSSEQIKRLQDEVVLMTEKDAIKYHHVAGDDWYYLPVDAELSAGFFPQFIQLVESKIDAIGI